MVDGFERGWGFRGHRGLQARGFAAFLRHYFELYSAQDAGIKGFSERLTVDSPGDSSLQVTLADRSRRRRLTSSLWLRRCGSLSI